MYMFVCTYVHVRMCVRTCSYVRTYMCVCAYVHVRMYVHTCAYVCTYMCVCAYMCVCTYMFVCAYMCVCLHIVTSVTTCLHLVLQLLYEPWERGSGTGTCMHSVQYSHMYVLHRGSVLCNPWVGRPGFYVVCIVALLLFY